MPFMNEMGRRACPAVRAGGAIALLVAALCACSGIAPYVSTGGHNFFVRADLEPGVRARIDVYRVDAQCRPDYRGSVALEGAGAGEGLALTDRSLLVFSFTTSSFWSGTRTMKREFLLDPRRGHRYEARLQYQKSIYNIAVRERSASAGGARELELIGLEGCRPRAAK